MQDITIAVIFSRARRAREAKWTVRFVAEFASARRRAGVPGVSTRTGRENEQRRAIRRFRAEFVLKGKGG
jgi:hypothetical protein